MAVFLALSRSDGRFAESDRHFVQAMVLSSSLCLVMGLTPAGLIGMLGKDAWFVSLIIGAIGGALVSTVMAWTQWHMPAEESAKVNPLWHVPPWSLAFVGSALIIIGLFDEARSAHYYVLSATVLVGISVWCFIAVVFRRFF